MNVFRIMLGSILVLLAFPFFMVWYFLKLVFRVLKGIGRFVVKLIESILELITGI